jgi:hypothetical protein
LTEHAKEGQESYAIPDERSAIRGTAQPFEDILVHCQLHRVVLLGLSVGLVVAAFLARPGLDVAGDVPVPLAPQQVRFSH